MSILRRHASVYVVVCSLVGWVACSDQPTTILDGDDDDDNDGAGASSDGAGPSSGGNTSDGAGNPDGGSNNTGANTSDGGAPPQPATFAITITATETDGATAEIDLRDTTALTVSIAPNGYEGPVDLALTGLPADVVGDLASDTVTLDGATTETVVLTVSSASNTATGTYPFVVSGTVDAGEKSGAATVIVHPVITIVIPPNLATYDDDGVDTTAFGDYPTVIKALPNMSSQNTITVNFFNSDTVTHEIHADDQAQGFGHGQGPIQPNSMDPVVRKVTSAGEYNYYPHDIGTNIMGQIVIE